MQTYSKFRPTGFDCAGLGCDDQQDWLVAPVGVNRDSDCLTRSNWAVVTADLESKGANDVRIHRFGHWACGWFEVCLVRPGSVAAQAAEGLEGALADYPVASDEHFSDLETNEAYEYWSAMSLRERVQCCQRARVNVFAARRAGEVPEGIWELLTERC
jgi:hypothetical protein